MSLSRAELEAMDRDELIDTIVELTDTVDDLQLTVDVLVERVNELEDDLDTLREEAPDTDRVAAVESDAKAALRAATAGGEGKSKTEIAKELTRDLLVVRAAKGATGRDRPVTVSKVQDKAAPEHDLKWSLVDHAWNSLVEEWPQFYETQKNGNKALSVRTDQITPALVRTVETSLDRDDLTKRFVGDSEGGGT